MPQNKGIYKPQHDGNLWYSDSSTYNNSIRKSIQASARDSVIAHHDNVSNVEVRGLFLATNEKKSFSSIASCVRAIINVVLSDASGGS